jgi:cytidylate kinase
MRPEGTLMFSSNKKNRRTEKPFVICIAGMAVSGKSTLAKRIAEKYKLHYFSGGDALRALAAEKGYESLKTGWWESREGMSFLEEREKYERFDKAVDTKLLKIACKGNVVLDSWSMPWLLENGFKTWLEASPEKRAKRLAERDKISIREALNALKRKEIRTKAIYKKLYGFDLGEDFAPFNFILDTENLEGEQVFQIVCMVIDNVALRFQNHVQPV